MAHVQSELAFSTVKYINKLKFSSDPGDSEMLENSRNFWPVRNDSLQIINESMFSIKKNTFYF